MKPKDIQVGKTYTNRGAGTSKRTVLAIGDEHRPAVRFSADGKAPDLPGVLYEQNGFQNRLYLDSFAGWAGREV